jgi:DNA-binding NarL/FixJ family response regulator
MTPAPPTCTYVSRMLTKLGCGNRIQAGLIAYSAGLTPR